MKARLLLSCAAGLAFSAAALAADSPKAPKPTAEHEKLGYFVGKWVMEGEMKPSPMGPGGKLASKDNCEWFEGRFAVVCNSTGTSPMGPTKALALLSYSPEEKAYTYYGIDNSGMTSVTVPRGKRDGDTWTYDDESKMGGRKVRQRYSIKEVSATEYSFKFEMEDDDGKWIEVVTGKETKAAPSKKKKK